MKIILTTDFSSENEMLFPYALDLLRSTGGQIIVFHAYMDQVIIGESVFPGGLDSDTFFNRELLIEMEKHATTLMDETVSKLNAIIASEKLKNVTVSVILKGGDPEIELVQLTESEKPDLVLMGMRGKGRKGFLEGSMSKSIMTKVTVPVLAIPEGYHWSTSSQVLYATNFSDHETEVIKLLFAMLKPYIPVIHVVHLQMKDNDNAANEQMDALRKQFAKEEARQQIRFHCIRTSVAREALQVFCDQHHVSMASFIANKRSLLDYIFKDKVGKDDFFSLNIPLLTFSFFND
ncbi:MAG: universal stress protein [Bacteroidetes bacterium]|nr:universal stress protein [Bacteroidota bacterium]